MSRIERLADYRVKLLLGEKENREDYVCITRLYTPRPLGEGRETDWTVWVLTGSWNYGDIIGIVYETKHTKSCRMNEALLEDRNRELKEKMLEALNYIDLLDNMITDLQDNLPLNHPIEVTTRAIEKYHGIANIEEYYREVRGEPVSEYRKATRDRRVWYSPRKLRKFLSHILEDKEKSVQEEEHYPITMDEWLRSKIPVIKINAVSIDPREQNHVERIKEIVKEEIIEEYGEWALNPDVMEEIDEIAARTGEIIQKIKPRPGKEEKRVIQPSLSLYYEE